MLLCFFTSFPIELKGFVPVIFRKDKQALTSGEDGTNGASSINANDADGVRVWSWGVVTVGLGNPGQREPCGVCSRL